MSVVTAALGLLSLVREGKKTVDEVMDDPKTREQLEQAEASFRQQLLNEAGDAYTRRARPTLIYVAVLAFANDLLLAPYMGVTVLTEEKFQMLTGLLAALGLARSVLDKQGPWLGGLLKKVKGGS